jgi:HAD superfamily hydrolase (TIGR01490 family)
MNKGNMSGIVFFDVDNVLIKGQSQIYLVKFLFRNKFIKPFFLFQILFWFFLYKLHFVYDIDKVRNHAFLIFKDWDTDSSNSFFKLFYEKEIKPRLIEESIRIIKEHQENGREVVLLSASLREIVSLLAKELEIKHVIATNLEISAGIYTGKIKEVVPYGIQKKLKIEKFLKERDWKSRDTFAYCDHITDEGLLQSVKNPFVVNPDSLLRKLAIKNKWPILILN